ncbi:unnamed protein product [Cyprideis torosa]|uniref:Histone deacetylase domain-containing protein n=1 Tax=Cyprideis torosa TaxID=163714 RepID=A0A7R8WQ58_9CRUS|nr:unnamed protein product [Cyprideis torosa]CAG0902098.1 unnamed protein product [Cyprideis torosa]
MLSAVDLPPTNVDSHLARTAKNILNLPLTKTDLGDADYLALWFYVVLPAAFKFNPDLVLVSASDMRLSPALFPHLVRPLMSLAEGKVALVFEGGYDLDSQAKSAALLSLGALLGSPCPPLPPLGPVDPTTWETLWEAISRFGEDRLICRLLNAEFVKPPQLALPPEGPQPPFPTRHTNPSPPTLAMPVPGGPQQPSRVALVYDAKMEGHESMEEHEEKPERVRRIMENLESSGVAQRCAHVPSREAKDEEVLTVHDKSLLDIVKRIKDLKPSEQLSLDSIYVNGQTETAARVALGSMLNLTDWVIQGGKGHSGLAVIRPPGHHAESDEPSGFCFFNNVAIAAKRALEHHKMKRVLVVDWDVHHGNGIQNAFLRDPRVLYISLHLFLGGSFYPESQGGAIPVVGEREGKGFNVNIPWEQTKMGDPEYIQAFLGLVLPICYEFNPELVLVSAGFDAAVGDPLGKCSVTPACYGVMTNLLCPLAEGKMVVALEGGYNLASTSSAMTLCAKALLGDPPGRLDCNNMKKSATEVLRGASAVQAPFWRLVFRQPPKDSGIRRRQIPPSPEGSRGRSKLSRKKVLQRAQQKPEDGTPMKKHFSSSSAEAAPNPAKKSSTSSSSDTSTSSGGSCASDCSASVSLQGKTVIDSSNSSSILPESENSRQRSNSRHRHLHRKPSKDARTDFTNTIKPLSTPKPVPAPPLFRQPPRVPEIDGMELAAPPATAPPEEPTSEEAAAPTSQEMEALRNQVAELTAANDKLESVALPSHHNTTVAHGGVPSPAPPTSSSSSGPGTTRVDYNNAIDYVNNIKVCGELVSQ